MKPGSIVVVLPIGPTPPQYTIKWLPKDDEKTEYVIRSIHSTNTVTFEEGVIGKCDNIELGLNIKFVREVQPPEEVDIQALLKESEQYSLQEIKPY